ncbi:MAG TPA: FixH family protein [Stellaceae bacterium]|nr:FixH family protein [Stellaceae bacterium]
MAAQSPSPLAVKQPFPSGTAEEGKSMSRNRILAAVAIAMVAATAPGWATASDYRFELDGPPATAGKATVIKVHLIHMPDGKRVSGAVIFQTRFDMGPDGMGTMTAPAKAVRGQDADAYAIEVEPSMSGNWALTLAAKVQGETDTVRGTVIVTVPK